MARLDMKHSSFFWIFLVSFVVFSFLLMSQAMAQDDVRESSVSLRAVESLDSSGVRDMRYGAAMAIPVAFMGVSSRYVLGVGHVLQRFFPAGISAGIMKTVSRRAVLSAAAVLAIPAYFRDRFLSQNSSIFAHDDVFFMSPSFEASHHNKAQLRQYNESPLGGEPQDPKLIPLGALSESEMSYYDIHKVRKHPELKRLMAFMDRLLTDNKGHILFSVISKATEETPGVVRLHVRLLYQFIHTGLVSHKELHLLLRSLLPSRVVVTMAELAKYYNEPSHHLELRSADIVQRLERFTLTSPQVIAPMVAKITNVQQVIKMIHDMSKEDLHKRISWLRLNQSFISLALAKYLTQAHVTDFYNHLSTVSQKAMFAEHILKVVDSPPIPLSDNQLYQLEILLLQLKRYANDVKNQSQVGRVKKHRKKMSTESETYLQALEKLSKDDFHKLLVEALNYTEENAFEKDAVNITKSDIREFMDQYHGDKDLMGVFLGLVLKVRPTTIQEYASTHGMSKTDVTDQKIQLSSDFESFIQRKLKRINGDLEHLSLNELRDIFNQMAWPKLAKLIQSSRFMADVNFDKMSFFNKESLILFSLRYLKEPYQKHIFLSLILSLDETDESYISQLYSLSINEVIDAKVNLESEIIYVFTYGDFVSENHKSIAHVLWPLPYEKLAKIYDRLKKVAPKYLVNQSKIYFMESRGHSKNSLEAMDMSFISYFESQLSSQLEKHVFFSLILALDQSQAATIARSYSLSAEVVERVNHLLVVKIEEAMAQEEAGTARIPDPDFENVIISADVEKLQRMYASVHKRDVFLRLKAHIAKLRKSFRYDSQYQRSQAASLKKMNVHHLRYFVKKELQQSRLKWYVFLAELMGLEKNSLNSVIENFHISPTRFYATRNGLIDKLLHIIEENPQNAAEGSGSYLNHSAALEELWQVYAGLSHNVIAQRIKEGIAQVEGSAKLDLINPDSLKFFVEKKINTPLKQRVFLSVILRLDNSPYGAIVKEYQGRPRVQVFNAAMTMRIMLASLIRENLAADVSHDLEATQPIKADLEKSKKAYEQLSDSEVMDRIKGSHALKDYPELHDYLTVDVVNMFIHEVLNSKRTEKSSQKSWHLFFRNMMDLSSVSLQSFTNGYRFTNVGSINALNHDMKKSLITIMYDQSADVRETIKGSAMESWVVKLHKKRQNAKTIPNLYHYYSLGYLQSSRVLDLDILKYRLYHLNDKDLSYVLSHYNARSDNGKENNDESVHVTVLDRIVDQCLHEDIDWHVFFSMIFPYYNPSSDELKKVMDPQGSATSVAGEYRDIIEYRKSQLESKISEIIKSSDRRENTEILVDDGPLDDEVMGDGKKPQKRLLSYVELRDIYFHELFYKDIIEKLVTFVHKGDNDKIADDMDKLNIDERALDILARIHHKLRHHPASWHIYLSRIMELDDAQERDIRDVYGQSKNEYFTLRSKIADQIRYVLEAMTHLSQKKTQANTG
ncbi:MAG: hypothetical protein OXC44_05415 [Proteobacteria bacterium]|nr:hypothetical protein [Pseudomonadota bacterium]